VENMDYGLVEVENMDYGLVEVEIWVLVNHIRDKI